ncbi:MAG TPA: type II secretion system minor pseudopilin GspI [bacterium]|nr:type II secretion system minor pseudopilin GspI [bacterium]
MKTGKNPTATEKTRSRAGSDGFTLLEVVAALAILAVFLVPILGAVSQGLTAVAAAKNRTLALQLAQDKMTEFELMKMPDAEGADDGDFPLHPGFTWQTEAVKTPEIQLMENYILGLQGMEIHLRVFWNEGGTEKTIQLNTLFME